MIRKFKDYVVNEENNFKSRIEKDQTFKKLKALCKKYGYDLKYAYNIKYNNNNIRLEIKILPDDDNLPKIRFEDDYYGKKVFEFKVTTEYNSGISFKEFENFIKNCQNTYNLIKELNNSKSEFDKLPFIREDELYWA